MRCPQLSAPRAGARLAAALQSKPRRARGRYCGPLAAAPVKYAEAELTQVLEDGQPAELPPKSGVYAVFDDTEKLQYVGISRNVNMSVATHAERLGPAVHSVKVGLLENATKADLTDAWKAWLQEAVTETGGIPPGNAGPDKDRWAPQRAAPTPKPEIRLTSGKGASDLTCSITDLIKMVVENERVVAFIKGTRTQPQCGFSYELLNTLNGMKVDYQVVDVLDDMYNPGLREGIKEFSAWPTIPQLYVGGEFVGGSDIVQEMAKKGELAKVLNGSGTE